MASDLLILQRAPALDFGALQPTPGYFFMKYGDGRPNHRICNTLELPWKDNQRSVSCVVPCRGRARWTRSQRFSKAQGRDVFMWELLDIPDRSGIRVHSGNYAGVDFTHSLGCVLPCTDWKDINRDGILDGTASKAAMDRFLAFMEPWKTAGVDFEIRAFD